MTLDELGLKHDTDKSSGFHGYLTHYEDVLGYLRDEPIELLEVGVWAGGSIRMWAEFFSNGHVTGVDVDLCWALPLGPLEGQYRVNVTLLEHNIHVITDWLSDDQRFDVVIDDGSHSPEDIMVTWTHLWPRVKPGGYLVIEDLDVQPDDSPVLSIIESLQRELWHERGEASEILCYPQLVFIRKRP